MRQRNKNRINIVLDLDNTLISAIDNEEAEEMGLDEVSARQRTFRWENMDGEFKIFERPHLQEFLDWLFANFTVSVWTAASKLYALFIIKKFILEGHPERKLDCVLFSHHCRESKKTAKFQKCLSLMVDTFPLGYDPTNTYIVDDNKEVYDAQPKMCIRVKEFDVQKPSCVNDKELLKVMKKLEAIRISKIK